MATTLVGDSLNVLLRVNLAASAAIILVLLLRKIARRRFGARVGYILWLLPAGAGLAVLAPARQIFISAPIIAGSVASATQKISASTGLAGPLAASTNLDPRLAIFAVWLTGIAVAGLLMTHLQRRFMAETRKGAIGPAVVGVIAPRIVTPADFDRRFTGEERTLVLAHEHAHLDRQDSRVNGASAVIQCLCWFNPIIHVGTHLMRIDQEMACDETVAARFPDARRAYAEALVKAQLAIRPLPLGCYWPSPADHPLFERIAMLKLGDFNAKRRWVGGSMVATLCVGAGVAAWAAQPADVRLADPPAPLSAPSAPRIRAPSMAGEAAIHTVQRALAALPPASLAAEPIAKASDPQLGPVAITVDQREAAAAEHPAIDRGGAQIVALRSDPPDAPAPQTTSETTAAETPLEGPQALRNAARAIFAIQDQRCMAVDKVAYMATVKTGKIYKAECDIFGGFNWYILFQHPDGKVDVRAWAAVEKEPTMADIPDPLLPAGRISVTRGVKVAG